MCLSHVFFSGNVQECSRKMTNNSYGVHEAASVISLLQSYLVLYCVLVVLDKIYTLKAASPEEASAWLSHIHEAMGHKKKVGTCSGMSW